MVYCCSFIVVINGIFLWGWNIDIKGLWLVISKK